MIGLFRKLRRNSMNGQSNKRYFFYAIGEILLILLGILLAFQVNKWKEDQNKKQLLTKVLTTLKDETVKNLSELNKALVYRENLLKALANQSHLVNAVPISELGFDVNNDAALVKSLKDQLYENLMLPPEKFEIIRRDGKRYLTIGQELFRLAVANDSLKIYGNDRIQLKTAYISNEAWNIALATNTATLMNYELLVLFSNTNQLIEGYITTSDKALENLYNDNNSSVFPILEDMLYYEKSLKANYEKMLSILDKKAK